MSLGWIKIHRKLLDSPLNSKPNWAWLWVVILLLANHEDKKIIWNGKTETIKRGSFITSRQQLSKFSHLHQSMVERCLKYLEIEQQIEQQTTKRFRLINVINYDRFQNFEQQIEQQLNNKRTTTEQQLNTNNNDKNIRIKEYKNKDSEVINNKLDSGKDVSGVFQKEKYILQLSEICIFKIAADLFIIIANSSGE